MILFYYYSPNTDIWYPQIPFVSITDDEIEKLPVGPVPLPPQSPALKARHTLVLDLSGTLIWTEEGRPNEERIPDFVFPTRSWFSYKRPYVDKFLKRVSELYEVVLFTAGVHAVRISIEWMDSGDFLLLLLSLSIITITITITLLLLF